uniref:COMM domain-containing protein n=1 Tax=Candidatus Kentrum sp. TC TaxID=2126339 RepID=A0A450Z0P3_9GAMM|nr:MAG: hypothetical protein BECKTC1821D_GA0114238_104511 [Candidatus Kentron sp. TC]VFK57081.1 MAG: hypothetical protein BECKTC1821F_GA0114240_101442 [Candidatus Kentron sp. TC]
MNAGKKLRIAEAAGDSFRQDFGFVLGLPSSIIEQLAKLVNTKKGIIVNDTDKLLGIWKKVEHPVEELQSVLSVLKYLYGEGIREEISPENIIAELSDYCEKNNLTEEFEQRKDAILEFITPLPGVIDRARAAAFSTSTIPVLYSMSGVIDLRAAFADEKSDDFKYFIPIAEIRLVTFNDNDQDTEIPFLFQVTEEELDKLIGNLQALKKQLRKVKSISSNKLPLFDMDSGLGEDK